MLAGCGLGHHTTKPTAITRGCCHPPLAANQRRKLEMVSFFCFPICFPLHNIPHHCKFSDKNDSPRFWASLPSSHYKNRPPLPSIDHKGSDVEFLLLYIFIPLLDRISRHFNFLIYMVGPLSPSLQMQSKAAVLLQL